MRVIKRSEIFIPKRQRTSIASGPLSDLRDSILARGLFHPPVIRRKDDGDETNCPFVLVIGERRLRALDGIASDNMYFICDGTTILPNEVPTLLLEDLSVADFASAELEENILREDLSWQDRIRAINAIHQLRVSQGLDETAADTARHLIEKREAGASGAQNLSNVNREVTEARILAQHLDDPQIGRARNSHEAFQQVIRKQEASFGARLIERRGENLTSENLARVLHADAMSTLPKLDRDQYDLILCDPPYAIGADSAGFNSRSKIGGHIYEDSPESARKLIQMILLEGFRLTKPRANLFLFLDIDLFPWAKETAQNAGWTPYRTPLTWVKSDSEGLAPWGSEGPRRTCEWVLYATKGGRGLLHSPVDVFRVNRVSRADRAYGPEKPVELLRQFIECSTLPGDFVLDPCCGSGSTLIAAKLTRRRALGIEVLQAAYEIALNKINEETSNEEADPPSGGTPSPAPISPPVGLDQL